MRKIYIDCGAWTGDSVVEFKKHHNDYDIYAFECHPSHKNELTKLSKKQNFTFINKAVWVNNGVVSLYIGTKDRTAASTLRKSKKKKIDKSNPVSVECIDFSEWVRKNFDKKQYIICKMNIEGAEYNILEKMLSDGTLEYINKLFVSWHYSKIEKVGIKKHNKFLKKIKGKIKIFRWNFVEGQKENPFGKLL